MKESDPLQFERLVDWLDGRLPADEAAAIARQVETADEATRADIAWLQMILGHRLILASPPPALHQQLLRRYTAYSQQQTPNNPFPRFLARPTFDSYNQRASLGLRGAAYGSERQVVYTSETADIALNISLHALEEKVDLTGQVFPFADDNDQEMYSVQLLQNALERRLTITDELGEFSFKGLPPGRYDIVFTGPQTELLLTAVDLRA